MQNKHGSSLFYREWQGNVRRRSCLSYLKLGFKKSHHAPTFTFSRENLRKRQRIHSSTFPVLYFPRRGYIDPKNNSVDFFGYVSFCSYTKAPKAQDDLMPLQLNLLNFVDTVTMIFFNQTDFQES